MEKIVITAYIHSSCTSCRKTEAWLKESGAGYMRRDFFRDRLSSEELTALLDETGLSASDILSTRSKVYKERQDESDALSEGALIGLITEEPTLLRRPIVVGPADVVIGHNPKRLQALIESETA